MHNYARTLLYFARNRTFNANNNFEWRPLHTILPVRHKLNGQTDFHPPLINPDVMVFGDTSASK